MDYETNVHGSPRTTPLTQENRWKICEADMIDYLLGIATGLLIAWLEYRIHTRKLAAEQRWLERVFDEDHD